MKNEIKVFQNKNNKKKLYINENISFNNLELKKYSSDIQKQIRLEKIKIDSYNKKFLNLYGFKKRKNLNCKTMDTNYYFKSRNEFIIKDKIKIPFLSNNKILYNSFDSYDKNNNLFYNNNSSTKNSFNNDFHKTKLLIEKNPIKSFSLNNINNNKKILKRNKENTKSSIYTFNNKNTFITSSTKFSDATKTFKEINKLDNLSNTILTNFKNKVHKIHKNYSTLSNKELLYLKKYKNVLLDPINILKKYNMRKQAQIFEKNLSLNNFLNANKEISKNNLILNVIKSELSNLIDKEAISREMITNKKNEINRNKIIFDEYKDSQKKACRKIDKMLLEKQKENRSLIEKEYNIYYDMHIIKAHFRKILAHIDECRIYGKFINEVLGGDTTRFNKNIFPKISDKELNFDYELLTKQAINNYKCFLNENDEFEKDEKFLKENAFIKEPNQLIDKYIKIQNNIIEFIQVKESLKEEIKRIQKEKNIEINYLREIYNNLIHEYESLKENYEQETITINKIKNKIYKERNEFYDIIMDLYSYIVNILDKVNDIDKNNNDIFDILKNINDNIWKIEYLIDELMENLNNYEENDKKIFHEIVANRKNEIKIYKRNLILQRFEKKSNQKKEKYELNKRKITFIARKTEAPFRKHKKAKKVLFLNEKQIEELENTQLINYEN